MNVPNCASRFDGRAEIMGKETRQPRERTLEYFIVVVM